MFSFLSPCISGMSQSISINKDKKNIGYVILIDSINDKLFWFKIIMVIEKNQQKEGIKFFIKNIFLSLYVFGKE